MDGGSAGNSKNVKTGMRIGWVLGVVVRVGLYWSVVYLLYTNGLRPLAFLGIAIFVLLVAKWTHDNWPPWRDLGEIMDDDLQSHYEDRLD